MAKIEIHKAASLRMGQIIYELAKANFLTGFWDNQRGKLAKEVKLSLRPSGIKNHKHFLSVLNQLLSIHDSEIISRHNCELRCKWRTEVDILIEDWVGVWEKKSK